MSRLSLRTRIFLLLTALVGVNCTGALITLWYISQTQTLFGSLVTKDLQSLLAAEKLGNALAMQKGYLTYYYLTGDDRWLDKLNEYDHAFQKWLSRAREESESQRALSVIGHIQSAYRDFKTMRDQVVNLYRQGRKQQGEIQHWKVRKQFEVVYAWTERFKSLYEEQIRQRDQNYARRARLLSVFAWASFPLAFGMGCLLAILVWWKILEPIRRLSRIEESSVEKALESRDEVKALSQRMHHLLEDVNRVHEQLAESREHLVQSEKLALVGKLAAGMAHSIRNPLTSVKMRLFSLERSLVLDEIQIEDFEVISEEIAHIDTIVRNFLEFSRPPKLKMEKVSPSDVVDMTLQLLYHRLESYDVKVSLVRNGRLPPIRIDPDQIKELLVNLLLNACEAMGEGGRVEISERIGTMGAHDQVVLISVKDNGPGIPEELQGKIFEPFFSTKEEGSGLGLAIAKRILADHHGWIHVRSKPGHGTTFVLGLPCEEWTGWLRS